MAPTTVRVVTVSVDELLDLISQAVQNALVTATQKQTAGVQRISASRAARLVRRRPSLICAACASGALPAQWLGRRWSIRVADLDVWAASLRA